MHALGHRDRNGDAKDAPLGPTRAHKESEVNRNREVSDDDLGRGRTMRT